MTSAERQSKVEVACGAGMTDHQRADAIEIVYEAFRDKLHNLLLLSKSTPQVKRILPASIDFSRSLIAIDGDHVCGVLMMNRGREKFMKHDWPLLRHEFGWLGAAYRLANYWLMTHQRVAADELNIQALAVCPRRRGQGIGSRLLAAAEAFARKRSCRLLSLNVVDTNPRARELYLRVGFTTKKTFSTWPFTRRAGFRSYDSMQKLVRDAP